MTAAETVIKLTKESTGTWLIETQGSTHLWDLDKMTWVRRNKSGWNPMTKDEKTMPIVGVQRWPEVGETFFIWTAAHTQAFYSEWHQSSTIKSITRVNENES